MEEVSDESFSALTAFRNRNDVQGMLCDGEFTSGRKRLFRTMCFLALAGILVSSPVTGASTPGVKDSDPFAWPSPTQENMPGTRWWWMGNAVDPNELTRELKIFREAGLGTMEITPIYGVRGHENQEIDYLSPRWMEMLGTAVTEAGKLGIDVDMATGTGWCFGGPNVGDQDANALAVYSNGSVSQKPSGQKVKRPAPGGEGWMLNLLCPDAMTRYLQRFGDAFAKYHGPKPRTQFHDSYEYKSDWSPDFLAQFEKRRGYRLQDEFPALFEGKGDADRIARVRGDYRETVSDLIGESISRWTEWSHDHGFRSRNQAHGSPGNWLDIYAASDIPETEFDFSNPDILISKFASSAAHESGKNLVSSETGTWSAEHFTETLARLKSLCDGFFLAGVNRIMWHGTAYSPADAPWPGWCFYASTEMNPRNALWHDVPVLHAYLTRAQSLLQSGYPDNDVLLYWPIHDFWHGAEFPKHSLVEPMSVHGIDWFSRQPIGKVAKTLWEKGYAFDYVSDKLLQKARWDGGVIGLREGRYRAILVPDCTHMPPETMKKLAEMARGGVSVIFEGPVPRDVPGLHDLEKRRSELREFAAGFSATPEDQLDASLAKAGVRREEGLERLQGVHFVRRVDAWETVYFVANRGDQAIDQFVKLAVPASQAVIMDPMSGAIGLAEARGEGERAGFRLQLEPWESLFLRTVGGGAPVAVPPWNYLDPEGLPILLRGTWKVKFLEGGPVLPKPYATDTLRSWTESDEGEAKAFAGTALYTLLFDAPAGVQSRRWILDLGKVVQSARIRLNGKDLGTVFTPPFRTTIDALKPKENLLEVEVTGTSANRIRDLDVRGVKWKIFHDTNVVNRNYKPFDASKWPVAEQGLLGPVTLQSLKVH